MKINKQRPAPIRFAPLWIAFGKTKCLLAVPLLTFAAAAAIASEPKKGDLVGIWKIVRAVAHGEDVDPALFVDITRTFDGKVIIVKSGEREMLHASYTVDDRASPKRIDLRYLDGPRAGTTLHGIYEISGGVLKICTTQDGGAAPPRFESSKGSEVNLDFYERTK